MKLIASAALALSLAACGSASHSGGDSPSVDAHAEPQVPTGPAILPTVPVNLPVIGDSRPAPVHNAVLMAVVDAFKAEAGRRGVTIPAEAPELRVVDFIDSMPALPRLGSETLGYCLVHHDKDAFGKAIPAWSELKMLNPALSPLIATVPEYSATATDTNLKRVMFHELGHCLLGKDHDSIDKGRILGIMSGMYAPISDQSEAAFESLMDEYFTPEYFASLPNL